MSKLRNKVKYYTIIIVCCALFAVGCKKREFETKTYFVMGSYFSLTIPADKTLYFDKAFAYAAELASTLDNDSKAVSGAAPGEKIPVSKDFADLYESSIKYYEMSGGCFDPTAATLCRLYGFPGGPFAVPSKADVERAKNEAGLKKLRVENGSAIKTTNLQIDFGAIGKGYIADKTAEFLLSYGIKDFIVNAGGDMYVSGSKGDKPFAVGIVNPAKPTVMIDAIAVKNAGVATSGDYERFFMEDGKKINHIFKGNVFEPADDYASVSVVAKTAEEADALSTLYYLSDMNAIKKFCEEKRTPALVVHKDGSLLKLCGWSDLEIEWPGK